MQQPSQENTAGAAEHAWNIYCAWHSRAAEEQTRDRQNDIWKAFMLRVVIEWVRLIDVRPPSLLSSRSSEVIDPDWSGPGSSDSTDSSSLSGPD